MMKRLVAASFLLVSVTTFVGCGGDGLVTVSGKVRSNGELLPRGLVGFHSEARPVGAPISSEGHYQAHLPAGEYRVTVSAPPLPPEGWVEGQPLPEMEVLVDPRYALPKTSRLLITVPADKTSVEHNLNLGE